jgi:hypothetical protein
MGPIAKSGHRDLLDVVGSQTGHRKPSASLTAFLWFEVLFAPAEVEADLAHQFGADRCY